MFNVSKKEIGNQFECHLSAFSILHSSTKQTPTVLFCYNTLYTYQSSIGENLITTTIIKTEIDSQNKYIYIFYISIVTYLLRLFDCLGMEKKCLFPVKVQK